MKIKYLSWFFGITFLFSWPLFLTPLLFGEMEPVTKQLTIQGLWALAMWGPGIAAIVTTIFVMKQPFKSLRLNTLGAKRFYLWAWLLPIGLSILGGALTLLFGIAKLDLGFTMIRESMASAVNGNSVQQKSLLPLKFCWHSRLHRSSISCLPSVKSLAGAVFYCHTCFHLDNGKPSFSAASSGVYGMHQPSFRDIIIRATQLRASS